MCLLQTYDTYTAAPHDPRDLPEFYVGEALHVPGSYYQLIARGANVPHTYESSTIASDSGR